MRNTFSVSFICSCHPGSPVRTASTTSLSRAMTRRCFRGAYGLIWASISVRWRRLAFQSGKRPSGSGASPPSIPTESGFFLSVLIALPHHHYANNRKPSQSVHQHVTDSNALHSLMARTAPARESFLNMPLTARSITTRFFGLAVFPFSSFGFWRFLFSNKDYEAWVTLWLCDFSTRTCTLKLIGRAHV